jgi:hypothetical protein
MLGLVDLVPDCWLEVSLHPEGPATGQLNQGFVPKFHAALPASHAALPMVTLNILPYTYVTLTLTLGWITLFMEDMGEGALHREERK